MNPSEFYEGAEEWRYFHRCEADNCGYIIATTRADWNLDGTESCPIAKQSIMAMMEFEKHQDFHA